MKQYKYTNPYCVRQLKFIFQRGLYFIKNRVKTEAPTRLRSGCWNIQAEHTMKRLMRQVLYKKEISQEGFSTGKAKELMLYGSICIPITIRPTGDQYIFLVHKKTPPIIDRGRFLTLLKLKTLGSRKSEYLSMKPDQKLPEHRKISPIYVRKEERRYVGD